MVKKNKSMKKFNFKGLSKDLLQVIKRFHIVLLYVAGLATMSFLEINQTNFEAEFNVWGYFILSIIASISVVLYAEINTQLWRKSIAYTVLFAIFIYSFVSFDYKTEWETMQFAAILLTLILITFTILFYRKNTDVSFWIFAENITRQIITTIIYSSILFGGLALAIYAIQILFELKMNDKVYANLSTACYLILSPIYFLMNVPPRNKFYEETPKYAKFLRILGLYVLLPLLGIYLVILYLYLFKITISWELPNGWVTTLVSILALGGYLAKFLVFPIPNNKLVNFLNKYFSVLLLPLIVLMSVGLARRIADYGISINRLYVLVFNLWLYAASIYLFLTQSKHLRWLVISFSAVLFLASIGPWSVYAITKNVMEKNITMALTESNLLIDGKLIENKNNKLNISDTIALQISESINYYIKYYGIEKWKSTFETEKDINGSYELITFIGLNNYKNDEYNRYIEVNLSENMQFDIGEHKFVLTNLNKKHNESSIFKNKELEVEIINNNINIINLEQKFSTKIQLSSIVQKLYKNQQNKELIDQLLTHKTEKYLVLINSLSANYKSANDIEIYELKITIFVK